MPMSSTSKNSPTFEPQKLEVLYDQEKIRRRVHELGEQITRDFHGEKLCVVGILKGSFMFFADLVRTINLNTTCEFIGTSSYGDATQSSGVVQITHDLTRSITGENVLIVEDIIDTGLTMRYLLENFQTRGPKNLKVCSFLEKPDSARVKVPIDYVGFRIPNLFVVGYGLDYAGLYRHLANVCVLKHTP